MSIVKWQSLNTADSLSTVFNSLASGSLATTATIDNTSGGTNGALLTDAVLELILTGGVTAGTGAPTVAVAILDSPDGTNFPAAVASGTSIYPTNLIQGTFIADPSASLTVIVVRGLVILPTKFQIAVLNNLGVAFPASVTANLYRFGMQVV